MTAALIWVHALVALLFSGVAVAQVRRPTRLLPARLLIAALVLTALWALSIAGLGMDDAALPLIGCLRSIAWLVVLAVLGREGAPAIRHWRLSAYVATAACMVLAALLSSGQAVLAADPAARVIGSAALAVRMLATAAALVLAHRVQLEQSETERGGRQLLVMALAAMWSIDLLAVLVAWLGGGWPAKLTLVRGLAIMAVAPMIAVAAHRDGNWTLRMSRAVALRAVLAAAGVACALVIAAATTLLSTIGGDHARMVQTAFVFGTAAALLAIVCTPWLRAWARVVVAKHLFDHRYDYRASWMRFTDTLGAPGEGAAPLAVRVVKSIADLTDSPAGLLLALDGDTLVSDADWRWEGEVPAEAADVALVRHLEATGRIVDLDIVRDGTAPADEIAAIPAWLIAATAGWALVPLLHGGRLVGAIVLGRPPLARALDWEDFDLLGVAGRQVASYLAEDRAHAALAEAQRFEEFNRRFAFIMHDLKNLVSQLALVARNAERHAENPAFRADMIATLRDSSQRMGTLLTRLSQHGGTTAETVRAVDVRALADRLADARRAQHPIRVTGDATVWAMADVAALDTALAHLVQNAVEASAAGEPVTIAVTQGEMVTIEVTDRGCGMSAPFVRDELFKPFVSRKPAGFGIGAFEARQLLTAMGGRLSVDSREGEGSRFTIALPASSRMEQAA
jgi:putative PEP-CTERM system histidine kinase